MYAIKPRDLSSPQFINSNTQAAPPFNPLIKERNREKVIKAFEDRKIIDPSQTEESCIEKMHLFVDKFDCTSFFCELKFFDIAPDYFFTPDIFEINKGCLLYYLSYFTEINGLAVAYEVPLSTMISLINRLPAKKLNFLVENYDYYLLFRNRFNCTFEDITENFLTSRLNLKVIHLFYKDIQLILKKEPGFLPYLLKNKNYLEIIYSIIKFKKFQSQKTANVLDEIIELDSISLRRFDYFSSRTLKHLANEISLEYAHLFSMIPQDKFHLLKMAFHIGCSTHPLSAKISRIISINKLRRTPLEGLSSHYMLYYVGPLLNKLISSKQVYSSNTIKKISKFANSFYQLQEIEHLFQELAIQGDTSAVDLVVASFIFQLKKYAKSNSMADLGIFGFAGWFRHATTFVIKKEKSRDRFTFYIWNTGEHSTTHHFYYIKDGIKCYQTGVCWKGLKASQITNSLFFKKILLCRRKTYDHAENIYRLATKQFKSASQPIEKKFDSQSKIQSYGTCTWNSFVAATTCLIDDPLIMQQLKSAWTKQIRKDFVRILPPSDRTSEDSALLRLLRIQENMTNKKRDFLT